MDAPPIEMMQEVSARHLSRILGISWTAVVEQLKEIPEAYQTPGGTWRCPLWAYYKHQTRRGSK